jgi:lysozyme family protein
MSHFDLAFNFVMDHEDRHRSGKITYDAGGCTRWGIAARYNPGIDVAELTLDGAKAVYQKKYYAPFRLDELSDARVAAKLCDMIVNPGPVAVKLAQSIAGCEPDGAVGPATIAKLNAMPGDELLEHLCAAHEAYYRQHDGDKPYLDGLLDRAKDIPVDVNNPAPAAGAASVAAYPSTPKPAPAAAGGAR